LLKNQYYKLTTSQFTIPNSRPRQDGQTVLSIAPVTLQMKIAEATKPLAEIHDLTCALVRAEQVKDDRNRQITQERLRLSREQVVASLPVCL
jgi:hypothetical protein